MKRPFYNALHSLIFNPGHFFSAIVYRLTKLIPNDELYLKILYRLEFKRKLNLDNPVTYNEKLQWLKLYYHNPIHTLMADKYAVKDYVKNIIGEEYIISTLNVWERVEDINWDALPQQFVLKTTHDSGNYGVIICKDKSKLDISKVKNRLNKSLNRNTFEMGREWPYKNIRPRVIAEKYLEDESGSELKDYKFFCFDGAVKFILVATERQSGKDVRVDFFDREFNWLPFEQSHRNAMKHPLKPTLFSEMLVIAEKLSSGIPHVRVDLYESNGQIYFGEYTFFNSGGMAPFYPDRYDYLFGEWLKLPEKMI